jgi:hypothetical protein
MNSTFRFYHARGEMDVKDTHVCIKQVFGTIEAEEVACVALPVTLGER